MSHRYTWSRLLKHPKYAEYYDFMHSWCQLLETDEFTDVTRVYWILHDMHEFPLSKVLKLPIMKNAYSISKACYTYVSLDERSMD